VYKESCVRILVEVETGSLIGAINTEVVQELLYRYSHIGLADKGLQLSRDVLKYPLVVLPVTLADVRLAIDIYEAHRAAGMKPRDAIHAAVMQHNRITRILSADKHFDALGTIERVDPVIFATQLGQE
jgi:predicted nucleic acid-binding protein